MAGLESRTAAVDGRVIGFAEYGDPSGAPLIMFPGTPGSRLAGRLVDRWAHVAGCRVVSIDRPGFGLSSPQPGRRLADHTRDAAAVCDELGIGEFAAVGVSGGTPYVFAAAALMPERLVSGAIVSGSFGISGLGDPALLAEDQRRHWEEVRDDPETTRASYEQALAALPSMDPGALMSQQLAESPTWIKDMSDSDPAFAHAAVDYMLEALRQGTDAAVQEIGLLTRPWDIDLFRIRAEIRFWHGGKDPVPRAHVEAYAAALPLTAISWHEDLGHFDCVFLLPEVMAWLASTMQTDESVSQ